MLDLIVNGRRIQMIASNEGFVARTRTVETVAGQLYESVERVKYTVNPYDYATVGQFRAAMGQMLTDLGVPAATITKESEADSWFMLLSQVIWNNGPGAA